MAKGDATALKIEEFCIKNGITIPASGYVSKPNQTLALGTIGKQLNKHNEAYLSEAIKLIREALPTQLGQMRPDILDTIIKLKIEFGAKVKDSEIVAALKNFGDNNLITIKAQQLKSLDSTIKRLSDAHFKVFCSKIKELRKGARYYG